jgi:ankyrin repeat protein
MQAKALYQHKFTCTRAAGVASELHGACWSGALEDVKRLLADNANINCTDARGNTPLHVSATVGDYVTLDMLLTAKASVHLIDLEEQTPLMRAAARGSVEAAQSLVYGKSDLSAKDARGLTALALATFAGYERIQKLLLRAGAREPKNGDAFNASSGLGRFIHDELAGSRPRLEWKDPPRAPSSGNAFVKKKLPEKPQPRTTVTVVPELPTKKIEVDGADTDNTDNS